MQSQPKTVKQHFDECMTTYERNILHSELDSTAPEYQENVKRLLMELERMWFRFEAAGVLSIEDESLDDLTTNTLAMLVTPYVVADLHQRLVVSTAAAAAAPISSSSSSSGGSSSSVASNHKNRAQSLAVALHFFDAFLKLMVQLGVVTQKDVDFGTRYVASDRTRRIENSRKAAQLLARQKELDSAIAFSAARSKRMAELCAEDGDAVEERGGDEEELLRERAIVRLQWAVCDAFQQCQMSMRELEMLETLTDAQRREIVADYQRGIAESREAGGLGVGRDTYTILPGGVIMTGMQTHGQRAAAMQRAAAAGRAGQGSSTEVGVAFSVPPPLNTPSTQRELIRSEVFMERNRPTMTLDEFARLEMAEIDRQMTHQAEMQRLRTEEDERLGPDGIEERERQRQAHWDDWKDDNPPIGLSTKGNYS